MPAYYTNDARFDLPDVGFVDRTVTYLVGKSQSGADVILLVERRPLPREQSLRQAVAKVGTDALVKLRGYTVLGEREIEVASVPAIDVCARWRTDAGEPIYTRRTHLMLGATWLVIACEAPIAEREFCDAYVEQVLATFQLRD